MPAALHPALDRRRALRQGVAVERALEGRGLVGRESERRRPRPRLLLRDLGEGGRRRDLVERLAPGPDDVDAGDRQRRRAQRRAHRVGRDPSVDAGEVRRRTAISEAGVADEPELAAGEERDQRAATVALAGVDAALGKDPGADHRQRLEGGAVCRGGAAIGVGEHRHRRGAEVVGVVGGAVGQVAPAADQRGLPGRPGGGLVGTGDLDRGPGRRRRRELEDRDVPGARLAVVENRPLTGRPLRLEEGRAAASVDEVIDLGDGDLLALIRREDGTTGEDGEVPCGLREPLAEPTAREPRHRVRRVNAVSCGDDDRRRDERTAAELAIEPTPGAAAGHRDLPRNLGDAHRAAADDPRLRRAIAGCIGRRRADRQRQRQRDRRQ